MSAPVLSVLIVTWRVPGYLRECLRSLYGQMRLAPDLWETIVVDNASGDGSAEMVRREFPAAIVVENIENSGFGRANNQAFQMARGRYILLLNPDTVILDGALDRMLEILENRPAAGILGCRMLNTDGTLQRWTGGYAPGIGNVFCHFLFANRFFPARLLPPPLFLGAEPPDTAEVGWVSGACMLLRREALQGHLFDERFFMYGEDVELCQRVLRGGWKVLYSPRAEIVHHGGRSLSSQTDEVKLLRLRGLREVVRMRRGEMWLWLMDLSLFVAFLLRTVVFGAAGAIARRPGFGPRALDSMALMRESARTLFGGESRIGGHSPAKAR